MGAHGLQDTLLTPTRGHRKSGVQRLQVLANGGLPEVQRTAHHPSFVTLASLPSQPFFDV